MCEAAERAFKKEREEGIEEGMEKGMEKGEKKGEKKGIEGTDRRRVGKTEKETRRRLSTCGGAVIGSSSFYFLRQALRIF